MPANHLDRPDARGRLGNVFNRHVSEALIAKVVQEGKGGSEVNERPQGEGRKVGTQLGVEAKGLQVRQVREVGKSSVVHGGRSVLLFLLLLPIIILLIFSLSEPLRRTSLDLLRELKGEARELGKRGEQGEVQFGGEVEVEEAEGGEVG